MLSLNNKKFNDHVDRIYPLNLKSRTLQTLLTSAAYLDLYLQHDKHGHLTIKLYDKRDDFDFPIVNFPFLDSNIPASPPTVFTCRSWYDIQGLVPTITISVIDVVCWQTNLPIKVSKVAGWWWLWVKFHSRTSGSHWEILFPCAIWGMTYSNMYVNVTVVVLSPPGSHFVSVTLLEFDIDLHGGCRRRSRRRLPFRNTWSYSPCTFARGLHVIFLLFRFCPRFIDLSLNYGLVYVSVFSYYLQKGEMVICYASTTFSRAQKHYCTTRRELLHL